MLQHARLSAEPVQHLFARLADGCCSLSQGGVAGAVPGLPVRRARVGRGPRGRPSHSRRRPPGASASPPAQFEDTRGTLESCLRLLPHGSCMLPAAGWSRLRASHVLDDMRHSFGMSARQAPCLLIIAMLQVLSVLAGVEAALVESTASWPELLVSQLLHVYPGLRPQVGSFACRRGAPSHASHADS